MPLRHRVCQQNFQTVYIVHEQLFHGASAFVLNNTQRQFFKPFLQSRPQAEQRVISCFMREIQAPAIEKSLQHQTYQDQYDMLDDKGSSDCLPP